MAGSGSSALSAEEEGGRERKHKFLFFIKPVQSVINCLHNFYSIRIRIKWPDPDPQHCQQKKRDVERGSISFYFFIKPVQSVKNCLHNFL